MTLREASAELGVKVRTIRQWLIDGKIEAVKMGKQWDISPEEITRKKQEKVAKQIRRILTNPARETEKEIRFYLANGDVGEFNRRSLEKNVNDLIEFVKQNEETGIEHYEYINALMYGITCDAVALVMFGEDNEN